MNRMERRRLIYPWKYNLRVRMGRAIARARMPKGYHEAARAKTEARNIALARLLGMRHKSDA